MLDWLLRRSRRAEIRCAPTRQSTNDVLRELADAMIGRADALDRESMSPAFMPSDRTARTSRALVWRAAGALVLSRMEDDHDPRQ